MKQNVRTSADIRADIDAAEAQLNASPLAIAELDEHAAAAARAGDRTLFDQVSAEKRRTEDDVAWTHGRLLALQEEFAGALDRERRDSLADIEAKARALESAYQAREGRAAEAIETLAEDFAALDGMRSQHRAMVAEITRLGGAAPELSLGSHQLPDRVVQEAREEKREWRWAGAFHVDPAGNPILPRGAAVGDGRWGRWETTPAQERRTVAGDILPAITERILLALPDRDQPIWRGAKVR